MDRKKTVYLGISTVHSCRHPLEGLDCTLWVEGNYFTHFQSKGVKCMVQMGSRKCFVTHHNAKAWSSYTSFLVSWILPMQPFTSRPLLWSLLLTLTVAITLQMTMYIKKPSKVCQNKWETRTTFNDKPIKKMWNIPHLPNGHKTASYKISSLLHLIVIATCRDKLLSLFLSSCCREKKKEKVEM